MSTYLVFGGTGNVGRRVVERLARAGAAVRATSRRPRTAGLPAGVEVVTPDLYASGALDGVEAVFLMWPFHSAEPARRLVDALKRQARRVVFMTGGDVRPGVAPELQPTPVARWHATVEHLIEQAGMEWTIVSPSTFMANTLWWSEQIKAGDVVRGAYRTLKTVPIHEDDIAAVAVHALTEDGHAGRRYALTGPEVLTQEEQVRIIGEAIGRPLRWHELTREEERARLLADPGFPDGFVDELLDGYATLIAAPPPAVSTAVLDITGAPATQLSAWAAEHAAGFGGEPR
ncbi:NAD(P)H-binding protein [Microbispora sp. NBRC 16548]|uniref:SDR family oxidoreductase n=1 Tax=Microbispora sp. NBRC 16548 TaxID=3030994 RepID=UPI0024A50C64|nr:NAD(P)H-binding protein [Microbispora sp. NBRC 16548]GLX08116.1 nucleotide-diphosphate-sugar epimerase [Microbispora sp. NBRC 16548]